MRMSKYLLKTFREAPQDAEVESHKLLIRAGYIQKVSSGVYSYLPLGLRVLVNISQIIRSELNKAGAQELLFPALTPYEWWQESGRDKYFGEILPALIVKARNANFVLGPTHEEVVTKTVSSIVDSYKSLGICVYQIQSKFRDEPRPRFGLVRTKELIMADAYSFDKDKQDMKQSYEIMLNCYEQIFKRLGLQAKKVQATSGAIGGDVNHEFMIESEIGEDFYLFCPECNVALNIEAYSLADAKLNPSEYDLTQQIKYYDTPGLTSVKDVKNFLKNQLPDVKESDFLKTIAAKKNKEIVILLIAGNRQLADTRGFELLNDNDFENHPELIKGFLGPYNLTGNYKIIADYSVRLTPKNGWISGANQKDKHVGGLFPGRDFQINEWEKLSKPIEGDPCPNCAKGLKIHRSVEVGHTFQLGLTYSSKIKDATFLNEQGQPQPYWMGCYGIGVSRLISVIAQCYHDDKGLTWPVNLAPFKIHLIAIDYLKNPEIRVLADELYSQLIEQSIEVLFDDRGLSAGISFNDADLIGIPYQIIIGPKLLNKGKCELKLRSQACLNSGKLEAFENSNVIELDVSHIGSAIKDLLLL